METLCYLLRLPWMDLYDKVKEFMFLKIYNLLLKFL